MTIQSPQDSRDAIRLFTDAQAPDIFIGNNLKGTTKDHDDSATIEEISQLAKLAIEELDRQRQEGIGSCGKLKEQAETIKNYLFKKIDHSHHEEVIENLSGAITGEIKQLDEELDAIKRAKKDAKDDGLQTSRNIKSYNIKSKEALIEIAKLAVQSDKGVSAYIKNYGIDDQSFLTKITGLAWSALGWETENLANFNQNQKVMIEIAKLAAEKDPFGTSDYIHYYGIRDPGALIEIARLAMKKSPFRISEIIQNYGIKDQAVLIELAKLSAEKDGLHTSEYIKNYGIKDPAALIEIAKLAASNGEGYIP